MSESAVVSDRTALVGRDRRLEYFTVGWNAIEGVVAVVSGVIAGSIALVGFGLDSFIEVTSGLTLLWRMSVDADVHRRELNEQRALTIMGACFLLLAAYVAYESASDLHRGLTGSIGRQITHFSSEQIYGFGWSPDGKKLLVARGHTESDVILLRDTSK